MTHQPPGTVELGGVVLCGGRSRRMGQDKATLPFGPECLLQRVVRLLSAMAHPIAVVAAADQALPTLPAEVIVVRDPKPDQGPLQGIAEGLAAVRPQADAAYVTSCDAPLLQVSFVRALLEWFDAETDIVTPWHEDRAQPLAAIYRTCLADKARRLVAQQRLRPLFLMEESRTRRVPADELRQADAELCTLWNLNTPEDYQQALRRANMS